MLEQQERFMAMMVTFGLNNKTSDVRKTAAAGGGGSSSGNRQRGIPGKVGAARKYGVCSKDGVRLLDAG